MPYLMIDLDDVADCRRGMQQLRQIVAGPGGGPGPRGGGNCDGAGSGPAGGKDKRPLRKKLEPLKQRGVWRFLSGIAGLDETPRSLAEFDQVLGLKKNKMRSMKAIFAKLENRLDVRFLVAAVDEGLDEAGNARYRMPPKVRRVIRNLSE